mgnify:CR=1 FL=1
MIEKKLEKVVKILKKKSWTIGVMESCTGGAIANCVTNIPGVSDVFGDGRVTYSIKSKIQAGVNKKIIEKFGVFSKEVAREMAKKVRSEIGIGVTGNLPGEVFVAVRIKNKIILDSLKTKSTLGKTYRIKARIEMKKQVVEKVIKLIIDNI